MFSFLNKLKNWRIQKTKTIWPHSIPKLKEKRPKGMSVWGKPTSLSAPANPNPWMSPKKMDITQGFLEINVFFPSVWFISAANKRRVKAIKISEGPEGK